jgi:hypothetical protein
MNRFNLRLYTKLEQMGTKETKSPTAWFPKVTSFPWLPSFQIHQGASDAHPATGSLNGLEAYLTVPPLACNDGEFAMHQSSHPKRVRYNSGVFERWPRRRLRTWTWRERPC